MAVHFFRFRDFVSFDYIEYLILGLVGGIAYALGKYLLTQNKNK
tara:strand:- start:1009 stop:1140 length:132 start_codon:yes stop_codon:yes gene_type:complete